MREVSPFGKLLGSSRISPRVRVLKLDDFVPVVVGALWRGKLTVLLEAFLGGTAASSTTVASGRRTQRRNDQLIE